jgi:hypothetical protein
MGFPLYGTQQTELFPMETVTGEQVVQAARKYLRVPFKLHGRDSRGMDCVGLVVAIAKQFGLDIDMTDYDSKGVAYAEVEHFLISHGFTSISHEYLAVGDIMTGLNPTDKKATAIAIVSGIGVSEFAGITRIIHCDSVGAYPRLRVVEDSMLPSDVRNIKQALSSQGLSMSDALQHLKSFRFPFVEVGLPCPSPDRRLATQTSHPVL